MNHIDIVNAWAKIREENNAIPDEVLDFMKDSAIAALNKQRGEFLDTILHRGKEVSTDDLARYFLEQHGWDWDNTESSARQVARVAVSDAGFWGRACAKLQQKLNKAETLLIKLVLMKQHKDKLGKTNYYNENQPETWKEVFEWYSERMGKNNSY